MKTYTNNIFVSLSNGDVRIVKTKKYCFQEDRDIDYDIISIKIEKDFKVINALQSKQNLNPKQLELLNKLENEYSCESLEKDSEDLFIKHYFLVKADISDPN